MTDLLTDVENDKIFQVIARDVKLQSDFLKIISNEDATLQQDKTRVRALADGPNFEHQICVICCSSFSIFTNRPLLCHTCRYKICKNCSHSAAGEKTPMCRLCAKGGELAQKRKEWIKLYPFGDQSFAVRKLQIKALGVKIMQDSCRAWQIKIRLEHFIEAALMIRLNDVDVNYTFHNSTMVLYQQKLRTALIELLKDFSTGHTLGKSMGSKLKSILESLFNGLRQSVTEMHDHDTDFELIHVKSDAHEHYESMLSIAVINAVVHNLKESRTSNSGISIGIQTEESDDVDLSDFETQSNAVEHVRKHRVPLPVIDVDMEGDSALETDDLDSVVSCKQNWFLKESQLLSPHGSLRLKSSSARIPAKLGTLLSALPSSYAEQDEESDSGSLPSSFEEGASDQWSMQSGREKQGGPKFLQTPSNKECKSGEKVVFSCKIATDPVELYWYNSSRELEDQGRYRIYSDGHDHYLEIYDAIPTDSGEIVCLAVNDEDVVNAPANLIVRDQDIAGEEPIVVSALGNSTADEGHDFTMTCTFEGFPEPRVTFYKNRHSIHNDGHFLIRNHGKGRWSLMIRSVQRADAGQFVAIATNRFGRVSTKSNVSVKGTQMDDPMPKQPTPNRLAPPKPARTPRRSTENQSQSVQRLMTLYEPPE